MSDSIAHQLDSIGTQLSSQISEVYNALPDAIRIYPAPYDFVDSNVMPVAYHLGLDKWDYTAIIIGVFSLGVAIWAMCAQIKTERNTMKITVEGQFGLLMDYIRHFYANLVVSKAMLAKLGGRYATHYISQEHFRKLQDDTEALHPEAFVHSDDKYKKIHNLLVLIRNFNLETEVAELHVCDENVPDKVKERDLNTLIFKQNLFCERFIDCIKVLCGPNNNKLKQWALKRKLFRPLICFLSKAANGKKRTSKQDEDFKSRIADIRKDILECIVKREKYSDEEKEKERAKVKEKEKGDEEEKELTVEQKLNIITERWKEKCEKNKAPIDYFTAEERKKNNFVKFLFPDDSDWFFQLINSNIDWEIHGKNDQGYDKIAIIAFKPEYERGDE